MDTSINDESFEKMVQSLFKNSSVDYEPEVMIRLIDIQNRLIHEVLADAKAIADHSKRTVDLESVKLAIKLRKDRMPDFNRGFPTHFASLINSKELSPVEKKCGIHIPISERLSMTAANYRMKKEKELAIEKAKAKSFTKATWSGKSGYHFFLPKK